MKTVTVIWEHGVTADYPARLLRELKQDPAAVMIADADTAEILYMRADENA